MPMPSPRRIAGVIAQTALLAFVAPSPAEASCQSYFRQTLPCPVGDTTYDMITGCSRSNFTLLQTEPYVFGEESTARRWLRCSKHNFPVYRDFTRAEQSALDALVEGQDYQKRKDEPWGQLSVWIEQQLKGKADPEWHGEMLLWDVMKQSVYGRDAPDAVHRGVLAEAAPLFIEDAETTDATGPALARKWARIAYVQYHAGQPQAAQQSQVKAEQAIGPEPVDKTGVFKDARHHLDVLDSCLTAGEGLEEILCSAGGLGGFWWFHKWIWNDDLIEPTRAALAKDPVFKRRLVDSYFGAGYLQIQYHPAIPRSWRRCAVSNFLDADCVHERSPEERQKTWLENFPEVFEAVEAERLRQFFRRTTMFPNWPPAGVDRKEAARRLAKIWPELAEQHRAKMMMRRSEQVGRCEVSVRYDTVRRGCEADKLKRLRERGIDAAEVERSRRERLVSPTYSIMTQHAGCRLHDEMAHRSHSLTHCREAYPFDQIETKLREDVADFDERYAEAMAGQVSTLALRIGRRLAGFEFSGSTTSEHFTNLAAAQARAIELYPETAALIETARLAQIKRRTTPR